MKDFIYFLNVEIFASIILILSLNNTLTVTKDTQMRERKYVAWIKVATNEPYAYLSKQAFLCPKIHV